VLNLLLVAFLFVLLGIQVPTIVAAMASYPLGPVALAATVVVVVVVAVRMAWAVLVPGVVHRAVALAGRRRARPSRIAMGGLSRRERVALGWCGPRGAVSLAVALSLPLAIPGGGSFAQRDLLVFLTVVVVLATLVGQVVPLPAVLRLLRLSPDERERTEGLRARRALVDAALREADRVAGSDDEPRGLEPLRQVLELRRDRLARQLETQSTDAPHGDGVPDERRLRLRLLAAERNALRELRARGEIGRRTMVDISQELDLDETRLLRPR
jgi:CPA1 family monovalent cation:H+ antiporter